MTSRRGYRAHRCTSAPSADVEQDIDTFLENALSDGRQRFRRKPSSTYDKKAALDVFESSAAAYDMLQMEERLLERKLSRLGKWQLKSLNYYDSQRAKLRYELEVNIKPKSVNLDQLTIPEVRLAGLYCEPEEALARRKREEELEEKAPIMATWIPLMDQSRHMRAKPGEGMKIYNQGRKQSSSISKSVDWPPTDWTKNNYS